MAKRLVIFCDGTWNEPEKFQKSSLLKKPKGSFLAWQKKAKGVIKSKKSWRSNNGHLTEVTNVMKLMRAVVKCTETHEQVTLYLRGLGTEGLWLSKKIGAMTGWGERTATRPVWLSIGVTSRNGKNRTLNRLHDAAVKVNVRSRET
jgi:hypothetical protein